MPFFKNLSPHEVEVTFLVRVNGKEVAEIPVLKTSHPVDAEWLKRRLAQLHDLRASIRRN